MLEGCQSAQERWGGISDIIDRWLRERQDMLVLYCELGNAGELSEHNPDHGSAIANFCQILVDYVSAGHFEIYQQLLQEGRDFGDEDGLLKASDLVEKINQATEIALDFNDKYLATDDLTTFSADLSELGESLAARFEAEDQMIAVLHEAHRELIAAAS